jgi:predicted enzyme related to lactoylglutathione lyase
MASSFIRAVDCLSLPVPDLDEALAFYRDCLGHQPVWRTASSVGLRLPESEAELVLHTDERRPLAAELRVDAVPGAVARFQGAGGSLVAGPFEIQIGRCAVVADPFGNTLVLLDASKGRLRTDADGNVVGVSPPAPRPDAALFESVAPLLSVDELKSALDYYQRVLGFQVAWTWGEPAYLASVCRDRVELNLGERGKAGPAGPSRVYIRLQGIDAYHERVRKAGAEITTAIGDRPYGMRDFDVRDPSGNQLDFGQPIEGAGDG